MNSTSHKESDELDPWLRELCEKYNGEHGRGWKRILASELGIHETNIQNWLRAGKAPAVIKALVNKNNELSAKEEEINDLKKELSTYDYPTIIVDNKDGTFSVKLLDQKTGHFKPPDQSLSNAHRIAAALSGEIDRLISSVIDGFCLQERCNHSDDEALIENLTNWAKHTPYEMKVEKKKKEKKLRDKAIEIIENLSAEKEKHHE